MIKGYPTLSDEKKALALAEECGWRVQSDGFVLPTRLDQDLKTMLIAYYRKAQWALIDDDGK